MFDVLGAVVAALDRAQIPHMVSGSIASARHGEARSTQDIDLVIDPTERQMEALLLELDRPNYYVGDGLRALSERSQFYVIDTTTGWKVDLMIRRDRPFSVVEFARRSAVDLGGVRCSIVSPEDSILSKLEWASSSRSERQLRDVRSLVDLRRDELDWEYLRHWAGELGIGDLLTEVAYDR